MNAEQNLARLEIRLPEPPHPFGTYAMTAESGSLLFLSGILATSGSAVTKSGVVGRDLDIAAGREALRMAGLNALAVLREKLGSLDRVHHVVRLGIFIASTPDFREHARVADSASELFRDVFGDGRLSPRIALGVASIPLGSPVALEVIVDVQS
jgi:enamine deaminase RidA (YjgF/YER057c/UK114 family)